MSKNDRRIATGDDKSSVAKTILKAMTEEENEDEVTEEDFKLKEEQDKLEADLLKMHFMVEDEGSKKKSKKEKKHKEKNKTVRQELKEIEKKILEETEDVQQFYEINRISRTSNIVSKIVLILLAALGTLSIASYLNYNYIEDGNLNVTVKKHEHDYTLFGRHVDGDCQNYGYTVFICNYPYCQSETIINDTVYGNHKYHGIPEEFEDEQGLHKVYTCNICGDKNEVILPKS